MRKNVPLSVRQLEVLRWVSDGCPDGVWGDSTYKTTAHALASRGLLKVNRRRNQWAAVVTDAGAFYLANGCYPSDSSAEPTSPPRTTGVDVDDLAAEVLRGLTTGDDKTITIASPSARQRAEYRRAINRLIISHQVPKGFVLRHTGRDRGDLTIRLVRQADEPRPRPAPTVQVPPTLGAVSSEVRTLAGEVRMPVTEASTDRALRILQAVASECSARQWTFDRDPSDDRRFRISTSEAQIELSLSEELVDREVPDDEQLSTAKYEWQRIPLHQMKVGSGRLTLQIGHYWHRKSWSDRRRWTLDDKLGDLFLEIERRTAEAAHQRRQREDDLHRRQQSWDAAVIDAKHAHVIDLNRRRLREQVTNHKEAQALREYAQTLVAFAGRQSTSDAEDITGWERWTIEEADRIDPINTPDSLHYLEPDAFEPDDLEPFMPKGMSAHHRPTK